MNKKASMNAPCRSCWRNCALETDAEMEEIDRLEDRIAPVDENALKIRGLISTLELCHHKAERWIGNIIEAIGHGDTSKGLGTRSPGTCHPAETAWQKACATLAGWCAGCPSELANGSIGAVPASRLLASLGKRSPLKEWQVQRVVEKIRASLHWPWSAEDPATQYVWVLYAGGEGEAAYHSTCPEQFKEHEDFWLATVRTIIHDTDHGKAASLSLGLAIDMLWPCHWRFPDNLQLVLQAIGGALRPAEPFAACGRNIGLLPVRDRLAKASQTLRAFCGFAKTDESADAQLLALLGEPTRTKQWLAASLDKTIRLQMDPPARLRAMSALSGPDWIREPTD